VWVAKPLSQRERARVRETPELRRRSLELRRLPSGLDPLTLSRNSNEKTASHPHLNPLPSRERVFRGRLCSLVHRGAGAAAARSAAAASARCARDRLADA